MRTWIKKINKKYTRTILKFLEVRFYLVSIGLTGRLRQFTTKLLKKGREMDGNAF